MSAHEITEIEPGIFLHATERCSIAVLPHVLALDASHVWVVEHSVSEPLLWREMQVPLTADNACERLLVRRVKYDFQSSTDQFLTSVLPRLAPPNGIRLLQFERPIGQSFEFRRVMALPNKFAILWQAGWRLTFELAHGVSIAKLRRRLKVSCGVCRMTQSWQLAERLVSSHELQSLTSRYGRQRFCMELLGVRPAGKLVC